ncbi:MAG: hypothetical protein K1563_05335, partial [Candidatus Thiodiazotropha sp. (ex. Lucinisca nassula)]|nr:hypothetical protein [Candidatus Thiodiazotropha sp. (ex. Lucinisca nassula)]
FRNAYPLKKEESNEISNICVKMPGIGVLTMLFIMLLNASAYDLSDVFGGEVNSVSAAMPN